MRDLRDENMIIKCSHVDGVENAIINIPDSAYYEIRSRFEDGIYLILSDKEIQLRDIDFWCQGRSPELTSWAVTDLYDEMVDVIADILTNNEHISSIDIDEIENDLISKKYEQEWLSKGYITIREDGSW